MKMKNKIIAIGMMLGIFMLWPFSCVPQTVKIEDGCDTIVIESPQLNQGLKACEAMLDSLTAANMDLTDQNKSLISEVAAAGAQIQNQADQISDLLQVNQDLTAEKDQIQSQLQSSLEMVESLTASNQDLTDQNKSLLADLNASVITVQQQEGQIADLNIENQDLKTERDLLITERDDLQALLDQYENEPTEITDTIWVTACFKTPEQKVWFHAGEIDVYPHRIYFPTEELEFIGVNFNEALTTEMKKYQNRFKLERKRDLLKGVTSYKNLYVDPAEYLPAE